MVLLTASSGYQNADSRVFGDASLGDIPLLPDIDGDGRADLAVWRASTGTWRWILSSLNHDASTVTEKQFGNNGLGDVPVLADVDGDGKTDLVVWRASTGTWYCLPSSSGYDYAATWSKQWGSTAYGDVPLPGGGGQ